MFILKGWCSMKHKIISMLLVTSFLVTLTASTVLANDTSSSSLSSTKITENNIEDCKSIELKNSDYVIYPATQEKINYVLSIKPSAIYFINGTIDIFNDEIKTNSDDFNDFLNEALDATLEVKEKQDKELNLISSQKTNLNKNNTNIDRNSSNVAIAAYNTGIQLVRDRGCNQTALYMEHARDIVGQ